MEEIFSTRRYLEEGNNKWFDMVAAKFLTKKVLSATEEDSTADSITLLDGYSDVPNNSVELTAISEESQSQENKTGDSLTRGVIDKACAVVEYRPNTFLETITRMAYSSESTVAPRQEMEGSITTSFLSLKQSASHDVPAAGKVMGREERDTRKKEFFELWESHVDYMMAQEQNVSLEYDPQALDTTNALISQEKSLQDNLNQISEDLQMRKKLLDICHGPRSDDLTDQERLLLDKLEDGHLSKDESSIFYRIEQSILNKDRPLSRCTSVESTGTQTTINSMSTSTPNYSTFGNSSDNSAKIKKKITGGDNSRIPIRSPKPRVLFEKHDNVPKKCLGAKAKVPQKFVTTIVKETKFRSNASAIFGVYNATPPKENLNMFQKRDYPSPSLWLSVPQKAPKRIAESPITPKTAKKPTKVSNVTMRKRAARLSTNAVAVDSSVIENRMNTFRDIDLETEKLRGTIDRCTDVISDIGQSVHEIKISLAEVATAQTEMTEEIKTLNKSR